MPINEVFDWILYVVDFVDLSQRDLVFFSSGAASAFFVVLVVFVKIVIGGKK